MAAGGLAAVCGEVVESVLTFLRLKACLLRRPKVRISNVLTLRCLHDETQELCCQFEVSATDLSEFNVDGRRFLSDLYKNSRYLPHAVSRSCKSSIRFVTRADGADASCIELHACTPEPILVESLACIPAGSTSEGFQLSFFIHVCEGTLLSEAKALLSWLHLLHIVNPDVCVSFRQSPASLNPQSLINSPSESAVKTEEEICFGRESYQTVRAFRVALGIHNYCTLSNQLQVPTKRMRFFRGSIHHLHSANHGDLTLYCSAALTPHVRHQGRKVLANRTCGTLHISVFSPTCAPLPLSNASLISDATSLVQWSDYGLKVSGPKTTTTGVSIALEITDCRDNRTHPSTSGILHLLVFLEAEAPPPPPLPVTADCEDRWTYVTKSAAQLRQNFSSLLTHHKAKFHQASHSALDKILHNYKKCEKTHLAATQAIQEVSEAVAGIIGNSERTDLQIMCAQLLENQQLVSNNPHFSWEACIKDKLWSLGTQLGLMMTSSVISSPEEPLVPGVAEDALTEAPTFVEGPSSKPVFALAGLVSAASVQSSGSPFEWSSVQHAVSGVIEQTTIAAAATTVTTGLSNDDDDGGYREDSARDIDWSTKQEGSRAQRQDLGWDKDQEGSRGTISNVEGFSCAGGEHSWNGQDTDGFSDIMEEHYSETAKDFSGTGEEEDFSGAGEEEDFSDAGVEENFSGAGEEEDFSGAGEEEDFSDAGVEENFSDAGEEEDFSDAGVEKIFSGTEEEDFSDAGMEENLSDAGEEEDFSGAGEEEDFGGPGKEEGFGGPGKEEGFSGPGEEESFGEEIFSTEDEETFFSIEDFSDNEGLGVNGNETGFGGDKEYRNSKDNGGGLDFRTKQENDTTKELCSIAVENVYASNNAVTMAIHKPTPPPAHSADNVTSQEYEPCSMNSDEDAAGLSDAEWDGISDA